MSALRRLPLLLMLLALPAGAQPRVPEIDAAVAGPRPAAADRPAQQRLAARLSAIVIDVLAREPQRLEEVVGAAAAAAPDATDEVVKQTAAAFPYRADAIAAAAGRPAGVPSPAPGPSPALLPAQPAYAAAPPGERVSHIASQAIAAIAADPAGLEAAVRAASAAAPQHRQAMVAEITRAYPLFADRIAAAGHPAPLPPTPPPPAPSATAAASDPFEAAEQGLDESLAPPGQEAIWDPIEDVNRGILAINDGIDAVLLRPVAWTYNALLPDPVILAIRRAVANLGAPVIFANDVLQLAVEDAAVTAGRFAVNSTVGVLGLFEVAEGLGLPAHRADFGQTLHSYGIGPGPYVMLPVLGPSTARDGLGRAVDVLFDPLTWLVPTPEAYYLVGTRVVVAREALLEPLDELRASSIDFYGALRSAYYQRRAVDLRKGRGEAVPPAEIDDLFDAAD